MVMMEVDFCTYAPTSLGMRAMDEDARQNYTSPKPRKYTYNHVNLNIESVSVMAVCPMLREKTGANL